MKVHETEAGRWRQDTQDKSVVWMRNAYRTEFKYESVIKMFTITNKCLPIICEVKSEIHNTLFMWSLAPIVSRMLSKEENALCRVDSYPLWEFWSNTTDLSKRALSHTHNLSGMTKALEMPSNLLTLQIEPQTLEVCLSNRLCCYWLNHGLPSTFL